jgi:hypothetical protein
MNVRTLFAIALAASAISANAQEPTPVAMPTVPAHNCVKPELPGTNPSQNMLKRFTETFKVYDQCIKKYIDSTKALADAATEAGNKAITEYNKLAEQIKAYNDSVKTN